MRLLLLALTVAAVLAAGFGCSDEPAAQPRSEIVGPVIVAREPIPAPPPGVPPAAMQYRRQLIREIQFYWGLAAPKAVFFAQCHQESRWKPTAQSKYASGLAQFTPDTAAWIQGLYPLDLTCGTSQGCPLDAGWAIRAMVLYDKRLYDGQAKSAGDERWAFTLLAYNGGLGWVNREQKAASERGLDATRYFDQVERVCVRAEWACEESRGYPKVILFKWRPLYVSWVGA